MTKQKTKNVGSEEEAYLDVFEAIKRAFIRRGFVRTRLKEPVKPTLTGPEKLIDLTIKAQDVLFKADTVFPFTLFPDTVTIDREKLTIANRIFFKIAKIISIPIADVLSVEADVGPFFGSIHVTSRYFGQQTTNTTARSPYTVRFLSRDNTLQIQHLLQGYIIAHTREIDCANIDKKQLIILLKDLGQGVSD
jgi:hypothetical protein